MPPRQTDRRGEGWMMSAWGGGLSPPQLGVSKEDVIELFGCLLPSLLLLGRRG